MYKQAAGELVFEVLRVGGESRAQLSVQRARVPGGWFVVSYLMATMSFKTASMIFFPDPEHRWDGTSLPEGA
jgi:hypothetical protein